MSKRILVVGGAGYIGSHMVQLLLESQFEPVVFDDLSTGHRDLVPEEVSFIQGDLKNYSDIEPVFRKFSIDAVMHFSASSLVGESVKDPIKYYENNVLSCIQLLKAMKHNSVKRFIFSSSAAVYGQPQHLPIREEDPTVPTNPYGQSKLMIEHILEDAARVGILNYISLRYFNAAGADSKMRTGERHNPESHLIPNVLKAACGQKTDLTVFGDDYDTRDGTCVRDYIHVADLARAHLLALRGFDKKIKNEVFNLGNGNGYSVLQIIKEAERVTGNEISFRKGQRRPGDPATLVACSERAKTILNWVPQKQLHEIIHSAWEWEMAENEKISTVNAKVTGCKKKVKVANTQTASSK